MANLRVRHTFYQPEKGENDHDPTQRHRRTIRRFYGPAQDQRPGQRGRVLHLLRALGLRQIAVNEARAQLRRKKPTLFSELSDEGEAEPELPDLRTEGAPEPELDRKETARLVREILDKLPDGQRLLLGMYYFEEISIQKIAEDLGLRPGTVKAQLNRGRKRVEAEVRRLEAQGVKLYGLAPLRCRWGCRSAR